MATVDQMPREGSPIEEIRSKNRGDGMSSALHWEVADVDDGGRGSLKRKEIVGSITPDKTLTMRKQQTHVGDTLRWGGE